MKVYQIIPGLIVSLLLSLLLSLRRLVRIGDLPMEGLAAFILLTFTYLFLSWLVLQVVHHTKLRAKEVPADKWIKAAAGIGMCIVLSFGYDLIFRALTPVYYQDEDLSVIRRRLLLGPGLRGLVVGTFQYFVIYYFAMTSHVQQARIEIERLKKENLEARLSLLKQQLSPHFLFNSLNTLKTMIETPAARQYIVQLSHVYRYLLSHNGNSLATLKDELEFTESYLSILKERFEDALLINTHVPEEAQRKMLPPLALQMLIENAIKHNVVSGEEPLTIEIRYSNNDTLEVSNNLNRRLSVSEETGTGLHNIQERYTILCHKEIETDISDNLFVVKIPLITA